MPEIGKILIALGMILLLVGLLVLALGRTNLPLGHLPGDIYYRGKNTTFYFPLTTCLLLITFHFQNVCSFCDCELKFGSRNACDVVLGVNLSSGRRENEIE